MFIFAEIADWMLAILTLCLDISVCLLCETGPVLCLPTSVAFEGVILQLLLCAYITAPCGILSAALGGQIEFHFILVFFGENFGGL